jgi:hypothetical protein
MAGRDQVAPASSGHASVNRRHDGLLAVQVASYAQASQLDKRLDMLKLCRAPQHAAGIAKITDHTGRKIDMLLKMT